jgi:hypothetical protein
VAYNLGEVWRSTGLEIHNASILFWALQSPFAEINQHLQPVKLERHGLLAAQQTIRAAIETLERAEPQGYDVALIVQEFRLAAALLMHGARRGIFWLDKNEAKLVDASQRAAGLKAELENLRQEFQEVWLRRNRPGGLQDSLAIFDGILAEYDE